MFLAVVKPADQRAIRVSFWLEKLVLDTVRKKNNNKKCILLLIKDTIN